MVYHACLDPQQQTEAYETLWRYLYRVTLHIMRNQPNADMLAEDCAQRALVRVHQRIAECRNPNAFRSWARQIAAHLALDELRRRKRLAFQIDDPHAAPLVDDANEAPEAHVERVLVNERLVELLERAPISQRSRRTVVGRYLRDLSDDEIAGEESELSGTDVQPHHIQVTRAKNMSKLRDWQPMRELWADMERSSRE